MFFHNFKYSFKVLFRNKGLIFWTFAFPILLGTFFNMAFSDIEKNEKLDIIDIAIVDNEEFSKNTVYKDSFNELGTSDSDTQLFNIEYTDVDTAKKLLDDNEIIGYLEIENDIPKIAVKKNGIESTVFKYVLDEIIQTTDIVNNISENKISEEISNGNTNIDFEIIYNDSLEILKSDDVKVKNISPNKLSYTMIEFYTLIAMTCLYGGIIGMTSINQSLANMSSKGKRVSVSPLNKGILILSSVMASYITQLIGLGLLFLYTFFILGVDYGSNLPLVILLGCVGSLAGLTIEIFVGTVLKVFESAKTGIIIAITMVGCFLSGMMGITMKYVIDSNIPILNKINPASMITDGFYSLYYYDTLNRYWFNIISLLIFAIIMILLSFNGLRRQKYDSI